ncbi:Group II intron-encoded protein LtrA [compost metagenome]
MNAKRLKTPKKKVQQLQEKLGHAAKENKKRKFHALYDKVYRWDILCEVWNRVCANKGSAGVDALTITDIEKRGVIALLKECQQLLKDGNYRPQSVRRHYIPKKYGKLRPLGIPTVRDRVIQMATKLVIEPVFEADFRQH